MKTNKSKSNKNRTGRFWRTSLILSCLLLTNSLHDRAAAAAVDSSLRLDIKAHDGEVTAVDISPDGRLLVSGGFDGRIKIWSVADGKELHAFGTNQEIGDVAFSPDGQRVVCAARNDRKKDVLQIWDYEKENMREEIEGHSQRINTVAYSPNGKMIASGSADNTVRTWYASNGREIQTYKTGKNDVLTVHWSPDSNYLAAGVSWDANILVWNASRDTLEKTLAGHGDWVTAVIYSPDGRNIISGSRDGRISIWDVGSGREQSRVQEKGGEIRSLAINSDGSFLTGATGDGVGIWYAAGGKLLDVLAGHSGRVNGVVFSADGRMIASGGIDGTVKLWSAPGAGNPEALLALAGKHEQGDDPIKADKKEAYKWYLQAAEAGSPEAMARVGEMSASGQGTAGNPQEAVKWLAAAVAKDHAGAMYSLGNLYASGKGVVADQDKAAVLWATAAAKGHVQAGLLLSRKIGALDFEAIDGKSLKWVEKAAEGGDVKAMYGLGLAFRNGTKDINRDSAGSIQWFMAAAKKGHVEAMYYVGESFESGQGVPRSSKDAMNWYRSGAEKGHAGAQVKFAEGLARGAGVDKSLPAAVTWYRKAAAQGNLTAKYRLGIIYCAGLGVKQDYPGAVKFWQETAGAGDAMSMFFLAYMYETGSGVKRDPGRAQQLYREAAGKGNVFARQALK